MWDLKVQFINGLLYYCTLNNGYFKPLDFNFTNAFEDSGPYPTGRTYFFASAFDG